MISITVEMQKENKSKNEMHTNQNQRNWYANRNQTNENEFRAGTLRLFHTRAHIHTRKKQSNKQTNKNIMKKVFGWMEKTKLEHIFQHKLRTILLKFQPAISHFFCCLW